MRDGFLEDPARLWQADRALVDALLAGDPTAHAAFGARMQCVPRFLAAANRRMGSPLSHEDLADLAQDAVVVIWQKLETFEGRATLESWCWRFCQLELANRVRLVRRRKALLVAHGVERLEHEAANRDPLPGIEHEHVERGLQALGPPEEEIIRLKHFEHLLFSQIAERLDIPVNTAKTRYYRGLVWLRRHLERRGEGVG